MDSRRIATTPSRGFRPVVAPGLREHGLLVRILERHLTPAHAALFAEPVPNPDGRSIDWYSDLPGEAVPLAAADGATQAAARARVAELHRDIESLAGRLANTREPEAAKQAEVLRAALETPEPAESCIWLVAEPGRPAQPTLVLWAHVQDQPDAPRGVLTAWARQRPGKAPPPAAAAAAPTAPAPPPAESVGPPQVQVVLGPAAVAGAPVAALAWRDGWLSALLWVLLALLALIIAWLALIGCGVGLPGGRLLALVDRCPLIGTGQATELAREVARQRLLEGEVAQLEQDLATRQALCRAGIAVPPVRRGAPSEADFDRRLQRADAGQGEVTVSLIWDSMADLDLHVLCPDGAHIYFQQRAGCGGTLDVDMNAQPPLQAEPVENIVWPSGAAPAGTYRVMVNAYRVEPDPRPEIPFAVRARHGGKEEIVRGAVGAARPEAQVLQFDLP